MPPALQGDKKRTAPAVHEQIPFPICQIRYAEREPATGRAVLLDDTAAQSNRPELSPGTAGPHVFYSTADMHNVRQFVTGHCPDEMTPDRIGQGSFLLLGFNHWVTSLSAGSAGLLILVGIPSAVFMFLSLRTRLAFM